MQIFHDEVFGELSDKTPVDFQSKYNSKYMNPKMEGIIFFCHAFVKMGVCLNPEIDT